MQVPNLFKETIKNTFYDKEIEIWSSGTITDDEGAVIGSGKKDKIDKFQGNFQYSTREYIQQEYGKETKANAIVTCENTVAKIGDMLVCNEKDFEIKSIVPSDSHITLLIFGDETNE